MNIPTFTKQQFVDKEGNLTPEIRQFFDVLFQQMQLYLSNDGLVSPSLPTSDIDNIANNSNPNARPNGTFWYDTTTKQIKAKENGVVKVVQLV